MSTTLICEECGTSATVELQATEPGMRIYLPNDESKPDKDLPIGFLLMADDAWFEEPETGLSLCAGCTDGITGGDTTLGLGNRTESTLHFTLDDRSFEEWTNED